MTERGVILLTTTAGLGARIVEHVRESRAEIEWTAVEPTGGRLTLLHRLLRARYDWVVVCWTGQRAHNRMKLLGLLVASRHQIYNENLDHYRVAVQNRSWLGHIRWRLGLPRGLAASSLTVAFQAYRWTVGLAIGAVLGAYRYASLRAKAP